MTRTEPPLNFPHQEIYEAIRIVKDDAILAERRRLFDCLVRIRTFAECTRVARGCVGIDDPDAIGTVGQAALVDFEETFDSLVLPVDFADEANRIFNTF